MTGRPNADLSDESTSARIQFGPRVPLLRRRTPPLGVGRELRWPSPDSLGYETRDLSGHYPLCTLAFCHVLRRVGQQYIPYPAVEQPHRYIHSRSQESAITQRAMSLLRLLSPSRAGSPSVRRSKLPSPAESGEISLTLRVPSFACIYMTPPDDPLWPFAVTPDLPRDDQLVSGELDIVVPPGSGRRRCKAIRVTYRSVARLNMGPMRGWEEDVIFERKCELVCGTSEGIILGEGLSR